MLVVHVVSTPSGFGGAERVVADLVTRAPQVDQVVLNPFAVDPEGSPLRQAVGPSIYEGMAGSTRRGVIPLRAWLRRRISALSPDVVHAHLFHASVLAASLPRRLGRAWVVTHHHGGFLVDSGRRFDAMADRAAVRRADCVVAVSRAGERVLRERYHCSPSKIEVILNGWSGQRLPRREPVVPRVVCVANLRAEKGHDVLLRAWARVVADIAKAELVVAGDGPLRSRLEAQAASLGDAVRFLGHVDDVWPLLATATVFVLPSSVEMLGISVLEAMAAGVPVVATAVGGVPEIVDHGRTGLLVPPNDEAALAAAMRRLLDDADERLRLAASASATADELHADHAVEAYVAMWSKLAGQPLP